MAFPLFGAHKKSHICEPTMEEVSKITSNKLGCCLIRAKKAKKASVCLNKKSDKNRKGKVTTIRMPKTPSPDKGRK